MFAPLLLLCLLLAGAQVATAFPLVKRKGGSGGVRAAAIVAGGVGSGGSGGTLSTQQWRLVVIIVSAICGAVVAAFVGYRIYICRKRRTKQYRRINEKPRICNHGGTKNHFTNFHDKRTMAPVTVTISKIGTSTIKIPERAYRR
ncbi:hypothetical protein FN846DRAFT_567001 [Sphaerosporella brunnea]|uniref:Transmembrane protein n=1 Tax=Sphaerosporella brunnea TaxID=1250544 RepID=A0A5J5FB46_9PEZI|nr:hypothetical protein FN846DRAFT_567001 [Sphaerosporella brunnea]